MINSFPFFRFPFYSYPRNNIRRNYPNKNPTPTNYKMNDTTYHNTLKTNKMENVLCSNPEPIKEKKSSKYNSIGPILINTDGFSNKEEPLIEFSGLKLYLDDIIILSLLFFLYKEEVKDDMLFILLILLLIS